jgi:hypothetical protein
MINLCPPAIVYLLFSITQILIDIYNQLYNEAVTKFIVAIMVTLLLNILCEKGLIVVSWLIVLVPFIFMTFIMAIILYIFGVETITHHSEHNITSYQQQVPQQNYIPPPPQNYIPPPPQNYIPPPSQNYIPPSGSSSPEYYS